MEDLVFNQATTLATIVAKQELMENTLTNIDGTLRSLSDTMMSGVSATKGSTVMQKVLIGAIIVQGVLSGILTPETARKLIHGALGGGG